MNRINRSIWGWWLVFTPIGPVQPDMWWKYAFLFLLRQFEPICQVLFFSWQLYLLSTYFTFWLGGYFYWWLEIMDDVNLLFSFLICCTWFRIILLHRYEAILSHNKCPEIGSSSLLVHVNMLLLHVHMLLLHVHMMFLHVDMLLLHACMLLLHACMLTHILQFMMLNLLFCQTMGFALFFLSMVIWRLILW